MLVAVTIDLRSHHPLDLASPRAEGYRRRPDAYGHVPLNPGLTQDVAQRRARQAIISHIVVLIVVTYLSMPPSRS